MRITSEAADTITAGSVKSILTILTFALWPTAAFAQGITVPQPPPGSVQVAPVPVACGAGQASRWNGTTWDCQPTSGSGGIACADPGVVGIRGIGGVWVVTKPDCTELPTSSSVTCGVNEAYAYAVPLGHSIEMRNSKCTITNATINVPAQKRVSFHCFGCSFFFDNQNQDGIVFDTQMYSSWINEGSVQYSGTGFAILHKPATPLYYSSGAPNAPWTTDMEFKFGNVAAIECVVGTPENCTRAGLNPTALIAIDINSICNGTVASSSFVLNKVRSNGLEGWVKPPQLFWYKTPTCVDSAGGENWFDFGMVQGASVFELVIGDNPGAMNNNLGTNEYHANISHVATSSSSLAVFTNSIMDRYYFVSSNSYNGGTPNMVYWGQNATLNKIITQQAIGWSGSLGTGPKASDPTNVICGYDAAHVC